MKFPKQEPPVYKEPRGDERERLIRMRTALVMDNPFFGLIACRLKLVEKPEVGTASTDGKNLYYNPSYIAGMDDHKLRGLWAHEVMHLVGGHCWRRGSRDHRLWNIACDYAIDPVLVRARFDVPNATVNYDWQGWSPEQIYAALLDEVQKEREKRKQSQCQQDDSTSGEQSEPGAGDDGGSAKSGGVEESSAASNDGKDAGSGEGNDDGNAEGHDNKVGDQKNGSNGKGGSSFQQTVAELFGDGPTKGEVLDAPAETAIQDEHEWKQAIFAAAQVAKSQGKLPLGFDLVVEDAVEPRVNWRAILMRFAQAFARSDYSWTRPSRRYISSGIYLPAMRSEAIPAMVLAVDTSASICSAELKQFAAEFSAIMEAISIEVAHLLFCDARVHRATEFRPGDTLEFKPTGGGGTDFRPVFQWVEEQGIEPSGLVYLTDMYGSYPEEAPPYPVLWASTTKENRLGQYAPPFGEFVYLDFE
jgi:predicted metal-dependent peptidase